MTPAQRRSRVPLAAAIATLAIHLIGNPHYGFFRDELYFIACGFHPAWGYVDQPPVVPLLSAATQFFGHSLFLLRAVPALFAAAGVYAACVLTIELGGGAFAQWLTALTVFISPVLATFGAKFTTDTPGLLLWTLAALFVVRAVNGGDPRWWIGAGAALGIAMESKYNALFVSAGLVAGLLLSPSRGALRSKWFFAGIGVAVLLVLPNLLWQAAYGFPMIELLRDGQTERNLVAPPWLFVVQQLLITNPIVAAVWVAGLVWTLRTRAYRYLGFAYLVLIALTCALHGKHYYVADAYPVLLAAGGVAIEAWSQTARWVRTAIVAAVAIAGLVSLPFTMPILSEKTMVAYTAATASAARSHEDDIATEKIRVPALLPDFSDMHGWPQLTAAVAHVYDALPAAERRRTSIFASNYGEAGAIDFFGAAYGLPPVISGNDTYYLWGTRGQNPATIVDVGGRCWPDLGWPQGTVPVTYFTAPWIMPDEDGLPISVCRSSRVGIEEIWPSLKRYI